MILSAPQTRQPVTDGAARARPARKPPVWRRRRWQLGALALVLIVVIAVALSRSQSASPTQTTQPAAAPLIAHGQIVPTQQARVGTQGGGVVQRLDAAPGTGVSGQTPLAWIVGPNGTELVTAPFAGTVTNVLVHSGDTLIAGATIAVVADLHTLQVETSDVDEFLIGNVHVGQRVQISVDAADSLTLAGTVANVALLPQTGISGGPAYPVIIAIGGLPPEVRAGMSVRVTFPEPSVSSN